MQKPVHSLSRSTIGSSNVKWSAYLLCGALAVSSTTNCSGTQRTGTSQLEQSPSQFVLSHLLPRYGLTYTRIRASVDDSLTLQANRTIVRADIMVRNRAGVETTLAAFIDSQPPGQRDAVRRDFVENCVFDWMWFEGRGSELSLVGMNGRRIAQVRPSSAGGVEFYTPDGTVVMHARTLSANTINPVFDATLDANLDRVSIRTIGNVPFSTIAMPPGVDLVDVLPTVFPRSTRAAGGDAGTGGQ